MKKNILLLLAFWLSGEMSAQRPSEINIHSSVLFFQLQNDWNISYKAFDRPYQLSFQYAQPVFQRMYLETAVSYSSQNSSDSNYPLPYAVCGFGDYGGSYSSHANAKRIGVELALRYQIIALQKWSMYASGGIAPSYDIRQRRNNMYDSFTEDSPAMMTAVSRLAIRYSIFPALHAEMLFSGRLDLKEENSVYKNGHTGIGLGIGLSI